MRKPVVGVLVMAVCALCLPADGLRAASSKIPVVPKWHRFEKIFKSSTSYSNAWQEVSLDVQFTSPLGETSQVDGFWDGGNVWKVRFSPDQPGRWAYKTSCSDRLNRGLHDQTGEFLCTAAMGQSRFHLHGPVRIARDMQSFEHEDGAPFFWMADMAGEGAVRSQPKDWELYTRVRSEQGFTAVLWSVALGKDPAGHNAFTGTGEQLAPDPQFFRGLELKLERLSQAGLLSKISAGGMHFPEWMGGPGFGKGQLSEDQHLRLTRYCAARWATDPAVSMGTPRLRGGKAAPNLADKYRNPKEWHPQPVQASIENAPQDNRRPRVTSDEVRRAAYTGLFSWTPAGVQYGAQGVWNWDTTRDSQTNAPVTEGLPLWHRALFMPGAKQMTVLARFFESVDFWRLRPQPQMVAQPLDLPADKRCLAAQTESRDLTLVYVPEGRTVELTSAMFPASPVVTWFNPRTGETNPAVGVVGDSTCQFPTPDSGDWVLVMKAGK